MKALSIRQPYAWLVTNGPSPGIPWKPVENREWQTDKNHFGPTLIHASSGMTKAEYWECRDFCRKLWEEGKTNLTGRDFPTFEQLEFGGIVGEVDIVGYIRRITQFDGLDDFRIRPHMSLHREFIKAEYQNSPWFFGTVGVCLRNCRPLPFRQCKGMLGFFNVALE